MGMASGAKGPDGPAVRRGSGSDAAATAADATEDEQYERDNGQDDENGPQHGETPSGGWSPGALGQERVTQQ